MWGAVFAHLSARAVEAAHGLAELSGMDLETDGDEDEDEDEDERLQRDFANMSWLDCCHALTYVEDGVQLLQPACEAACYGSHLALK